MPKMEVPGQSIYIAMFKDPAGNPIGLSKRKVSAEER
jgi:predicted enzyme related to lactoylglutathione lyase